MYILYYSEVQDNRSIYGYINIYIYTLYISVTHTDLQSDTQCTSLSLIAFRFVCHPAMRACRHQRKTRCDSGGPCFQRFGFACDFHEKWVCLNEHGVPLNALVMIIL